MTTAERISIKLQEYLLHTPQPLIGAETIQLIVVREILDYTVLRTEETRELNHVITPLSISRSESTRRVAFLAPKQKAAESRNLEHLLRSMRRESGFDAPECFLKDNLCMVCPRCGLHGATSTKAGQAERANIKHRIEYSTAFSLLPLEDVSTYVTFNAINDNDITTGQALGTRHVVNPATLFPSVVTLKSVTWKELVMAVKTLLSCKSYGAESRIGGDVRNTIIGVVAGWEEIVTSLELCLELYDRQENLHPQAVAELLQSKYVSMAGNPTKILVLAPEEVDLLVRECIDTPMNGTFLKAAYDDIAAYRARQMEKK